MGKLRVATASFLCLLLLVVAGAQVRRKSTVSKGPRALGLVEIANNGQAMLVPVTVMVDGEFYDASVYKADPVPMAVEPETVYEGFKAGVSQGLFTVSTGIQGTSWTGAGKWRSNAEIAAAKEQRQNRIAELQKKAPEDETAGGPPRLTRSPEKQDQKTAPSQAPKTDDSKKDNAPKESPPVSTAPQVSASLAEAEADRPVLRREPEGTPKEETKLDTTPLKGPLQIIPAISDAAGPQPRPYTYELKPGEEQTFLKKMEEMATPVVEGRAKMLAGEVTRPKGKKASAAVKPEFQNELLQVLDVSGTNEAVLVFTANATIPGRADLQYSAAVVARQDIYGDLHKIFSQITDSKHLDMLPRYEFIDAVDADGDGRGELLFRQVWDSGSGFAVYRVIGDRLWPLFESKPES